MRVPMTCCHCQNQFDISLGRFNAGRGKFCSHKCYSKNLVGKEMPYATRLAIQKSHIGRKNSEGTILKMRSAAYKRLVVSGWSGTPNEYNRVHSWVYRKLGKPQKCQHCKTETAKKFEWANISGNYLYDLSDWVRLCTRCHHKFDNIMEKQLVTKRQRGIICV